MDSNSYATSMSTDKLRRLARQGLGALFITEPEDPTAPIPRVVHTLQDVTRGLGLDADTELRVWKICETTRTDFNRRSGNQRVIGARGLLMDFLRGRSLPVEVRAEVMRRADAWWRMRDMQHVISKARLGGTLRKSTAGHKYLTKTPDGKGGWTYHYLDEGGSHSMHGEAPRMEHLKNALSHNLQKLKASKNELLPNRTPNPDALREVLTQLKDTKGSSAEHADVAKLLSDHLARAKKIKAELEPQRGTSEKFNEALDKFGSVHDQLQEAVQHSTSRKEAADKAVADAKQAHESKLRAEAPSHATALANVTSALKGIAKVSKMNKRVSVDQIPNVKEVEAALQGLKYAEKDPKLRMKTAKVIGTLQENARALVRAMEGKQSFGMHTGVTDEHVSRARHVHNLLAGASRELYHEGVEKSLPPMRLAIPVKIVPMRLEY